MSFDRTHMLSNVVIEKYIAINGVYTHDKTTQRRMPDDWVRTIHSPAADRSIAEMCG